MYQPKSVGGAGNSAPPADAIQEDGDAAQQQFVLFRGRDRLHAVHGFSLLGGQAKTSPDFGVIIVAAQVSEAALEPRTD